MCPLEDLQYSVSSRLRATVPRWLHRLTDNVQVVYNLIVMMLIIVSSSIIPMEAECTSDLPFKIPATELHVDRWPLVPVTMHAVPVIPLHRG